MPSGTKSLPEPVLTYHQWSPVAFTCRQFHRKWYISLCSKIANLRLRQHLSGANDWLNDTSLHATMETFQMSSSSQFQQNHNSSWCNSNFRYIQIYLMNIEYYLDFCEYLNRNDWSLRLVINILLLSTKWYFGQLLFLFSRLIQNPSTVVDKLGFNANTQEIDLTGEVLY